MPPWRETVPTLCLPDRLADHDAVKPWSDAVGVGLLALSPCALERRLDSVLRLIDVARHEAGEADEALVMLGHEGLERLHREARPTDPDLLRRRECLRFPHGSLVYDIANHRPELKAKRTRWSDLFLCGFVDGRDNLGSQLLDHRGSGVGRPDDERVDP